MELQYSYKPEEETKIAKAIGVGNNISFKKAVIVCNNIRGMNLIEAIALLEKVKALEKPLPFSRFQRGAAHRTGIGMGKYPKKASTEMLEVLNNAMANAEFKGLNTEKLKIIFVQANRGLSRRRRKPQGRWKAWKTVLVNYQVMVQETK
jgi:large subunit ribosomal protein L22